MSELAVITDAKRVLAIIAEARISAPGMEKLVKPALLNLMDECTALQRTHDDERKVVLQLQTDVARYKQQLAALSAGLHDATHKLERYKQAFTQVRELFQEPETETRKEFFGEGGCVDGR